MSASRKRMESLRAIVLLSSIVLYADWASAQTDGLADAWGRRYQAHPQVFAPEQRRPPPLSGPTRWLRHWNEIAIDASGLDHTAVAVGENRVFGEQFGPTRASRAMAIVHLAIFESVNAIAGHYRSYIGMAPIRGAASMEAAIAQSAHDTLAALFPSQAAHFAVQLAADLALIRSDPAKSRGIELGRRAALAILIVRANDGSQHSEPRVGIDFYASDEPGKWRQDPISEIPLALGGYWNRVAPFVMESAEQFRAAPPPALESEAYAAAFAEAKRMGGDGVITATERSAEQTQIGIYWAYDGTPSLCAPPRLYNQIAVQIAEQMRSDVVETARLLALANLAMADTAIAVWESKYHYSFWRPITGIREADAGTGPTGAGDGNAATLGDTTFSPLGAPASNLSGVNFTPPFPAYPSGHAGFGGALFQVLREFYGTDAIPFTFVSDEYNGVTRDHSGNPRPRVARSFASLSEAEEENGQSRIYLGIHWSFDKTAGIAQGRRVADHVLQNIFLPAREPARR